MIVVDASVLATALVDDGESGETSRTRLRNERLLAPELIDLEVISVWRRLVAGGVLGASRAEQAVDDLAAIPLERVPHRPLLSRCWELRENLTIYDAAYVALAELARVGLLTGDARLARAPGIRCPIEVV